VKNAKELASAVALLLTDLEEQRGQKSVALALTQARLQELDALAALLEAELLDA